MKKNVFTHSDDLAFFSLFPLALRKYICFLFVFFHFQGLFSQQLPENKAEIPEIHLIKGAEIFSADGNFNQNITEKKIRITGGKISVSYHDESRKLVAIKQSDHPAGHSFYAKAKNVQQRKDKKHRSDARKRMAAYEKQKAGFKKLQITVPVSSDHFLFAQNGIGRYFIQTSNSQPVGIAIKENIYSESQSNEFYSESYAHYSRRLVDRCFFGVFSIRPPPPIS